MNYRFSGPRLMLYITFAVLCFLVILTLFYWYYVASEDNSYTIVTQLKLGPTKESPKRDPMIDILLQSAVQSRRVQPGVLLETYKMKLQNTSLESCPMIPPGLKGAIEVEMVAQSWQEIEKRFPYLEDGGHGKPENCLAQHRTAIIIAYRNRQEHLRVIISHLHNMLRKQQLDYAIFVIEQVSEQTFNRAKLMNVGFVEAMKVYPWECFVFHDVDHLPEDDRILYSCPTQPRQMAVAIDCFDYVLPYATYFGGVTSLSVDHICSMNGFSNDFWGWGGEDDDLLERVKLAGYNHSLYPEAIARYKVQRHEHGSDKGNDENPCRFKLLELAAKRWQHSGLNTLNYKLEKMDFLPLYTHVMVDLMEKESREELAKHVRCKRI